MLDQQLNEEIGRSFRFAETSAATTTTMPDPVSGYVLAWQSATGPLANIAPETLVTVASYVNYNVERFDGDGATLAFTLAADPGVLPNTQVYVDGVYQQKNTYSLASSVITFTAAPPSGTGNVEVVYGTASASAVVDDGAITWAKLNTALWIDDDTMATASATTLASSESIKAYVDAQVATADTLAELSDTTITGPIAAGDMLLVNAGGTAWVDVPMSGDATLAATGAITLAATNSNLTTLANVTTVGALNAGSITSGFGNIDIGSSTLAAGQTTITTGASGATATANQDDFQVHGSANTGIGAFAPDGSFAALTVGSATQPYAATLRYQHSALKAQIGTYVASGLVDIVSGNGAVAAAIDASQDWDFQANNLTTTGTLGVGTVTSTGHFVCDNAAGPQLKNIAATSTAVTVIPNKADADTGLGWTSSNVLSLIAGGTQFLEGASTGAATFFGAVTGITTLNASGTVLTTGSFHGDEMRNPVGNLVLSSSTAIIAPNAAGTGDFGTAALPFGTMYLGDAGTLTAVSGNARLVLWNTSAAGDSVALAFQSGTSGASHIDFGDTADSVVSRINSASGGANFEFFVNNDLTNKAFVIDGSGVAVNTGGTAGYDFRVQSDNDTNAILVDASADTVQMDSLAGSGSRTVVADANGVLSAP